MITVAEINEAEKLIQAVESRNPSSAASDCYRFLSDGDIIRVGDEFIDDDAETWVAVGRNSSVAEMWMIGMAYSSRGILKPMRRKMVER